MLSPRISRQTPRLWLHMGTNTTTHISSRSIVMVKRRNKKKHQNSPDPKDIVDENPLSSWAREDTNRKLRAQEREYRKKLQEIKDLTKSVGQMVKSQEQLRLQERRQREEAEAAKSIPMPSDFVKRETDNIYHEIAGAEHSGARAQPKSVRAETSTISSSSEVSRSLARPQEASQNSNFTPSSHSHLILPSSLSIPSSIVEKLGLSIKYLISSKAQNWGMVLHQLQQVGGFSDLPSKDVHKLVKTIPREYLTPTIIEVVESMMAEADIPKTSKFVDQFIEGLSYGSEVSDETMAQIESYYSYLKEVNKKGKISRNTYELLIKASGKNTNLDKINQFLAEMKANNLQPSKETFSNILTCCVYKAKDHKQAVEIFDSMKFLSEVTKPTVRNYQDIIVSYINNDNIEKALDLYQEMLTSNIEVNQKILVALARGCAHRPELKLKSWEFMFEIYNLGWEPSLETFEYLLYLAASDGDLPLVRALYRKLNETKSVTPKAFSFLMLAYSKASADELPTITFSDKGKLFRSRVLNDTTASSADLSQPQFILPLLPMIELNKPAEIMAESSAMWAHTLMFNRSLINNENSDMYLKIALEQGNLADFMQRFETTTMLDTAGIPMSREITIDEPEIASEAVPEINFDEEATDKDVAKVSADSNSSVTSPLLDTLIGSNSVIKVPRSTLIYVTALKAAGRFSSYDFGQQIWNERGLFRKSTRFTSLSRKQKDMEDFQFASAMVSSLTEMGMLSDALAIVMSTEYQFRWTRKELSELYHTASEVGDENIVQTVKGITSRSLIKWEGKIRRKDYKKYVLERGY